MTSSIYRRGMLTAGTVALLSIGAALAASPDVFGTVTYAGGAVIPEGYLMVAADSASDAIPATRIASDGKSTEITFALPTGEADAVRVVAHLKRADGWLLARGSATAVSGTPVKIELFEVMY